MTSVRISRPIVAACAVQFAISFSMQFALSFLTLFIHSELGVGDLSEAALWVGISQLLFAACFAIMSPAWGLLSDRVGGKKMLVRVLIANTVVLVLLSLSTELYHVLIIRSMQGAMGGASTVVMAILASSVEGGRLVEAIGYQQSAQMIGFLLGPAIGAVMATIFGFRLCFILGSAVLTATIPFVLWGGFDRKTGAASPKEKIQWRTIKTMGRDFVAMIAIGAAYDYITPIVPLYLSEAGVTQDLLITYTGAILAASSLAYAVSVPVTTRVFKRRAIPFLLAIASGVVFLQGFFRQALSFAVLRMIQCFLHSPGPSRIFGDAGGKQRNRGLALGILNSARFTGSAIGPFLASGVAYAVNLTTAFTVIASLSLLAAAMMVFQRATTDTDHHL